MSLYSFYISFLNKAKMALGSTNDTIATDRKRKNLITRKKHCNIDQLPRNLTVIFEIKILCKFFSEVI